MKTPDRGAPESVLRLLSELGARMTSPLNVRRTAEAIGMTRERLTTRLNRMFTTFATVSCPQVDDAGIPVAGAQQKVYLLDPLPGRLPDLIEPGFPPPDMSFVSEATLAVALARAVETTHPGRLLEGRAIGYARTSTGQIDFAPIPVGLAGADAATLPIESKWVSAGWRGELGQSKPSTAADSSRPRTSSTPTTRPGPSPRSSRTAHQPTRR